MKNIESNTLEEFAEELFAILKFRFDELEFEFVQNETDLPEGAPAVYETLMVLLPITEKENILCNINVSRLSKERAYVQFYSTIFPKLPEKSRLFEYMEHMNIVTPIGAYGTYISQQGTELYHKYALIIRPEDLEAESMTGFAIEVLETLDIICSIIGRNYDEILELALPADEG